MLHVDFKRLSRPEWIALGVTTVPVILASLRLLAASGGDNTTLRVLIATLDVKALLFGSYLSLLPLVVLLLASDLIVRVVRKSVLVNSPDEIRRQVVAVAVVVGFSAALLVPWNAPLAVGGLAVLVLIVGFFQRQIVRLLDKLGAPASPRLERFVRQFERVIRVDL